MLKRYGFATLLAFVPTCLSTIILSSLLFVGDSQVPGEQRQDPGPITAHLPLLLYLLLCVGGNEDEIRSLVSSVADPDDFCQDPAPVPT